MKQNWKEIINGFDNKDIEDRYKDNYYNQSIVHLRILLLLSAFIYIIYYYLDKTVFPELTFELLNIRLTIFALLLISTLLTYTKFHKKYFQLMSSIAAIYSGVFLISILSVVTKTGTEFVFYFSGLILVFLAASSVPIRFVNVVVINLILLFIYLIVLLFINSASLPHLIDSLFFIVSSSGLTMVASYQFESFLRKDFKSHSEIEYLNNNLEQIVKERTVELEKEKQKNIQSLFDGQERERDRIAKELHDGIGIQLAVLKHDLEYHIKLKDLNQIEKSIETILKINEEIRDISHNQSPYSLKKFGYEKAIEDLVDNISKKTSISFNIYFFGLTERLPEKIELMIYRITQEAINNSIRHGNSSIIDLQLIKNIDEIIISIIDNGKGFNPHDNNSMGIGLNNIKLRVEDQLKGKVIIESEIGIGTTILINFQIL
jgi:signal transduction histidine kinase